ncbi:hypothetical protein [Sinorhizobium fredii]|nr:hypothetical protein [Sinorhizobium fredii]
MNIETFPEYATSTRRELPFIRIGQVWEMDILARVCSPLSAARASLSATGFHSSLIA